MATQKKTKAKKSPAKSGAAAKRKPARKTRAKSAAKPAASRKSAAKKPAAPGKTAAKKKPARTKAAPANKPARRKTTPTRKPANRRAEPAKKPTPPKAPPPKRPLPRAKPDVPPERRAFVFYRTVEPVDLEKHGNLSLVATPTYEFAAETNSIPLNAVEFAPAARHYPIIFNPGLEGLPLAVVGIRGRENLFVEADGTWAEGCYMPAFVRRYPFLMATKRDSNETTFCIDGQAQLLEKGGSRPLFVNGKASDLLQNVARFCTSYAREQNNTRAFVAALNEQKLLIERSADITLPDGKKVAMRGFRVVDSAKLRELPGDLVQDWWKQGWLGWISCHLISLSNFGRLYYRAKQKDGA